jgi:uncharacterized protein YvpB
MNMKYLVRLLLIVCLVGFSWLFFNKASLVDPFNSNHKPEISQGSITIVNKDANTQLPIIESEYTLIDANSNAVIETLTTDASGKVTSSLIDYNTSVTIRQEKIMAPYIINNSELKVEVNNVSQEITFTNEMFKHVRDTERLPDGHIKISKVYMDVQTLMQKPELPNGCEITSLTAVLNYYGFEVSKTEMADNYLPKEPFTVKNNKLYGPDPYKAYSGNPRNLKRAFFSYAPPIVEAANAYINEFGGNGRAADISGSTREQIVDQLNKGIPVIVWTTLDLSDPKINYGWYFNETGEYFDAPVNLHVVVINGYEDNILHVMNPLEGQVTYEAEKFFASYEKMGSHALIVNKENI